MTHIAVLRFTHSSLHAVTN